MKAHERFIVFPNSRSRKVEYLIQVMVNQIKQYSYRHSCYIRCFKQIKNDLTMQNQKIRRTINELCGLSYKTFRGIFPLFSYVI